MEFRLFVYGTLKHGTPAHARYCAGAVRWTRAWTSGRLYEHRDGYPVMVAPARAIHCVGTRDALADARTAAALHSAQRGAPLRLPDRVAPALRAACTSKVYGEILTFAARRVALDALDDYEGFQPGRPSTFVRVLIEAEIPGRAASARAWTYVAGSRVSPSELAAVPLGVWRP